MRTLTRVFAECLEGDVLPRPEEMSSEVGGGGDQALRALTEKGPKRQKGPQS